MILQCGTRVTTAKIMKILIIMKIKKMKVAENLEVNVIPDGSHEFMMTTNEVAKGHGVSSGAVRAQMFRNQDEFIEGKHFIKGVTKRNTLDKIQPHQVFWTKRGIVRLVFFIKSERARLFKDWAEDLVVRITDRANQIQELISLPEMPSRKHNRLTQERLIDILADVAKIDDKKLRLSLVAKLVIK